MENYLIKTEKCYFPLFGDIWILAQRETKLVTYERCIGPDRFRGLAFMIIIGEAWQHVDKYVTRLVVERLNPFPQEQEEEVYLEVVQVFGYSKSTISDMCPSMWQHFLILQT